ncbi:DNA polymerase III subunit delta [Candidatus Dojkabacteria bacterium]|nr:DNA polymerase III subunit delta [Candidatus Dojkabacteria bacterium]
MIHLLFGENSFASYKELESIKNKFKKDNPNSEIHVIEDKNVNIDQINFSSYGLFANPRLYIFKRFFEFDKNIQKQIIDELKTNLDEMYIIWTDRKIDKRLKMYKTLKKIAECNEFKKLNSSQMRKWILKQAKILNLEINQNHIDLLLSRFENNQALIYSELKKLKLLIQAQNKKKIDDKALQILSGTDLFDIWDFIQKFFHKQKKEALEFINNINFDNQSEFMIIGSLASQVRCIYLIKKYSPKKSKEIQKKLSIHPFTYSQCTKYAQNFSLERIKRLYQQLANLDFSLKQGKIFPKLALSLLVLSL